MTLAKNKQGFRSIIVNEKEYHWRITDQYIDIRNPENRLARLLIDPKWLDPSVPTVERNFDNNLVVTPGLVSEAILFALAHNWDPSDPKNILILTYDWKQFSIRTKTT